MRPILVRWGSCSLYSYSALVGGGVLLGAWYVQWRGHCAGCRGFQALDGALWTLLGGLMGARAAYVIPNWSDYAGRPAALLSFWGGGLVFQGGLIGGLFTLWLYSLWSGLSFIRLADLAAPAISLAQGLGWIGALMHGAHYGLVVRFPYSLWLPDIYGVYGPRFPTQLLASALGFLLLVVLHRMSERDPQPGTLASLYLLGNGAGHFLLEFTRADEASYCGLLRATQIAALVEVMVACVLWTRRRTMGRER